MRISLVNLGAYYIVVHQPVNDIPGFAVRSRKGRRIKQIMNRVDETVNGWGGPIWPDTSLMRGLIKQFGKSGFQKQSENGSLKPSATCEHYNTLQYN